MTYFKLETAKRVNTVDHAGNLNGFLTELGKSGDLTKSYLSAASPGAFKGYHLHLLREANYVCIRGKIKVIMYFSTGRKEVILDSDKPERLYIPEMVPTALSNPFEEEAWIINNPTPAYDPKIQEQVELTEEHCEECVKEGKPFVENIEVRMS